MSVHTIRSRGQERAHPLPRYVYPSEIATFGSVNARQKMISTGPIGRSWAQNYTTASRLPLHFSLGPPNTDYPSSDPNIIKDSPLSHSALSFVHGGLSPTYKQLTPFPSAINALSRSLLYKLQHRVQPPPYPPNPYPGLPSGKDINIFHSRDEETNKTLNSNRDNISRRRNVRHEWPRVVSGMGT